ncbi:MAG: hypothetical protein Q9202_002022 [Teloschistes flavicans]
MVDSGIPSSNQEKVFDIIAKEVGVTKEDLFEAEDFAELGIDDVLSKFIIQRIKEISQLDLPQTTFRTHPSATGLETYLRSISSAKDQASKPALLKATVRSTYAQPDVSVRHNGSAKGTVTTEGPLSILLQGKPAIAKKTLFLLPDGSGSGMVYSKFPQIASDVCVVALNSPFLNTPTDFGSTIEDLALMWTKEIRKRQPSGPYMIGGYSAGGYYSFEVAKQLQSEGEMVEKLIIIDSPCRAVFEALPMEVIFFLAEKGLLGDWGSKRTPDWFIDHFHATINAVERYKPTPMEAQEHEPECFIVWASDGVVQGVMDPSETGLDLSVRITRFMLNDKEGFGLHGWEQLLPGSSAYVTRVPGNHFSMIHPPHVRHFSPYSRFRIRQRLTNLLVQRFRSSITGYRAR